MPMHTHDHTHPQAGSNAEDMQACESAPSLARTPPPPCNTGRQKPPNPHKTHTNPRDFIFPRFDWYSATIQKEVEPRRVLRWAQLLRSNPMKAFHGYDECMDFGQLKILYGGMNGPHGVHVIIHGGDACQAIVGGLREAFPEHYPTRIDVCFDFQGDKAYDKLYGLALKTKRKFDIQCEKMGD